MSRHTEPFALTGDGEITVLVGPQHHRAPGPQHHQQHADNLASEAEHGPWNWGKAYSDTGSASKYAKKAREDFERLLSDLRTGAFGEPGTVLVLWEISRLARETAGMSR